MRRHRMLCQLNVACCTNAKPLSMGSSGHALGTVLTSCCTAPGLHIEKTLGSSAGQYSRGLAGIPRGIKGYKRIPFRQYWRSN